MAEKSKTFDDYLAPLGDEQRAVLEKLRRQIRAAAPKAVECISYGLPSFRLDGDLLVAMGAAKRHCAFYPMSGTTIKNHARELRDFETSKGAIRFQTARPLPAVLVRKLVKARIVENRA